MLVGSAGRWIAGRCLCHAIEHITKLMIEIVVKIRPVPAGKILTADLDRIGSATGVAGDTQMTIEVAHFGTPGMQREPSGAKMGELAGQPPGWGSIAASTRPVSVRSGSTTCAPAAVSSATEK